MEQELENVEETQQVDESKFQSADDPGVIKVDLSKPVEKEEDATREQSTDEVSVRNESETSEEVREENVEATDEESAGEKSVQDEKPVLEEITEEEVEEQVEDLAEEVEEAVAEAEVLENHYQKIFKS